MYKWNLLGLSLILLSLSACDSDEDAKFDVAERPNPKSFVSQSGFSAVIQANLPKGSQSSDIGAQLYSDALLVPVDGGDVFVVASGEERTLLNQFGTGDTEYAGTLAIVDAAQNLKVTTQHLPVETRQDRGYPVELAYVATAPASFVGLDFSVNYPQNITALLPVSQASISDPFENVKLQWKDAADAEQVEIVSYAHCLGQAKVIYRGDWTASSGTKDNTEVTLDAIFKQPSSEQFYLGENLLAFVYNFIDFIFNDLIVGGLFSSSNTIEECTVDFNFVALKYQELGAGATAVGQAQLSGGLSIMSRSEPIRILFKPTSPYVL